MWREWDLFPGGKIFLAGRKDNGCITNLKIISLYENHLAIPTYDIEKHLIKWGGIF